MTSSNLRVRNTRVADDHTNDIVEGIPVNKSREHVEDMSSEPKKRETNILRKGWLDSPIFIFYALVIGAIVSLYLGIQNPLSLVRNSDRNGVPKGTNNPDQLFIAGWMDHILSHPVQPSDRIGFAEMGLRTRVYARLLEAQSLSIADDFESRLWPFAPGAKRMRLAHFGPEPPFAAWKALYGEDKVSKQSEPTLRIHLPVKDSHDELQAEEASIEAPILDNQRGIVMSLGRSELRFAMHFLHTLRNVHKSRIPVELYYYGDDDLPGFMRSYLESSYDGVRTIDLEDMKMFDPNLARLSRQGWALKPFALLASNFSEVILADADVVFLTRPEDFFEVEGYKKTGTLFFHDRDHYREGASKVVHDFLYDQLGNQGPSQRLSESSFWINRGIYEQESGIVVVDKRSRAVFSALFFAAWQNTGSIRERTTYRVFWGDKESYWLAFELAGIPYYFVEHYAGGLGNNPWQGQFCSDHPLHFIPENFEYTSAKEALIISNKDSTDEKKHTKKKRPGRAAWFNGSLLENKGKNDALYMQQTAWAVESSWIFHEDLERWCLPNSTYSGDSLEDLVRGTLMTELIDAAREADIALQALESFVS